MLTAEQLRLREPFDVTGSFLPPLCDGDGPRINRQYRERNGLPVAPLVETWPMKYGAFLEPLVLDHHELVTGHTITRRGEVVAHPRRRNVGVTLDGWREYDNWVLQVKCCGAWQSIPHIINYYTCQAMLEAECVEAAGASLLIVHGGAEPLEIPIHVDDAYCAAVWSRIDEFIECVESLIEPYPLYLKPIIPPEKWRRINLDSEDLPNWGGEMRPLLVEWDETTDAAKANAAVKEKVKLLLPDDVGRVTCAGVIIARSRAGSVSIKRARAEE
jgi:hypothetical protein